VRKSARSDADGEAPHGVRGKTLEFKPHTEGSYLSLLWGGSGPLSAGPVWQHHPHETTFEAVDFRRSRLARLTGYLPSPSAAPGRNGEPQHDLRLRRPWEGSRARRARAGASRTSSTRGCPDLAVRAAGAGDPADAPATSKSLRDDHGEPSGHLAWSLPPSGFNHYRAWIFVESVRGFG